jgi:hypothetical protein
VRGFFRDQVEEEQIKAHLIGFGDGWPERICRAERHPYFRGQIGFRLRCCGLNLNETDAELVRLDAAAAQDEAWSWKRLLRNAAGVVSRRW